MVFIGDAFALPFFEVIQLTLSYLWTHVTPIACEIIYPDGIQSTDAY